MSRRRRSKKQRVAMANRIPDPLDPFPDYRRYEKNGIVFEIFVVHGEQLDERTKKFVFELTETNMKDKYESSPWGWSPSAKYRELVDVAARHLLIKDLQSEELVGFSHFRFDMDEGDAVLYCYELQVDKRYQRLGLGSFMMTILEKIAERDCMEKVVLTVLKNNEYSQFYRKRGYRLDITSPEDPSVHYEILSKPTKTE